MSLPKEGSRDVHEGIIVSIVPDICLTPAGGGMVPVPYTIWCRQADAGNLANSLRLSDDRAHAKSSVVLHCFGDEPGTGGGIDSGTTGAECTPMTWSPTVRAEDRNVVRHTDLWWMNHKNTFGMLYYTKDMAQDEIAPTRSIDPKMQASYQVASATPQPGGGGPSPGMPPSMIDPDYQPPSTPRSPPAPFETPNIPGYPGVKDPISPPTPGEPPAPVEEPGGGSTVPGTRSKSRVGTAAKAGLWAAAMVALDAWYRSSRKELKDCCIAPYFINGPVLGGSLKDKGGSGGCAKCKPGQPTVAHHGMIDYPLRSGGTWDSKYRAPSVPSYRSALTVCISSGSHKTLHDDFERNMDGARRNANIPGTVTFNDVKKNSEQGISGLPDSELSTDCKSLYKILLGQQYRPGDDTLMRGSPNAPTPETDTDPTRLNALKKSWGIH